MVCQIVSGNLETSPCFVMTRTNQDLASELRLLQGKDDGSVLNFRNAIAPAKSERNFKIAAISARAASMRTESSFSVPDSDAFKGVGWYSSTRSSVDIAPESDQSGSVTSKRRQVKESARIQKWSQLRSAFSKVVSLFSHDLSLQVKAAFEHILERGPVAKDGLAQSAFR